MKENMIKVIIPFSSFISQWSECSDWLNENIGPNGIAWKADSYEGYPDYAKFQFKNKKDAMAFKLRWM